MKKKNVTHEYEIKYEVHGMNVFGYKYLKTALKWQDMPNSF